MIWWLGFRSQFEPLRAGTSLSSAMSEIAWHGNLLHNFSLASQGPSIQDTVALKGPGVGYLVDWGHTMNSAVASKHTAPKHML